MKRFITAAALIIIIITWVFLSPILAQSQRPLDLSGKWKSEGIQVEVKQTEQSVTITPVSPPHKCKYKGEITTWIEGHLQELPDGKYSLNGKMWLCTKEKFISDCGLDPVYEVTLVDTTVDQNTISGAYLAEGYAYHEDKNGKWINCRRDDRRYGSRKNFSLTRICEPLAHPYYCDCEQLKDNPSWQNNKAFYDDANAKLDKDEAKLNEMRRRATELIDEARRLAPLAGREVRTTFVTEAVTELVPEVLLALAELAAPESAAVEIPGQATKLNTISLIGFFQGLKTYYEVYQLKLDTIQRFAEEHKLSNTRQYVEAMRTLEHLTYQEAFHLVNRIDETRVARDVWRDKLKQMNPKCVDYKY